LRLTHLESQGEAMRRSRKVTIVTVVALVLSMGSVQTFRAQADPPDPGVATLVKTLNDPANSVQAWSQGLGTVGKLGEALPAVQTSPGGALGFGDLLTKSFTSGANKLADAVHDADLDIAQPISIGGGRTGTLTSSLTTLGTGDKQLSVSVDIARTMQDQPLSIAVPLGSSSSAPQSALSATGGVQLQVSAKLQFQVVWDHASDTAYLVVDAAAHTPQLSVDASAQFHDTAAVKAALGILGVSLLNDSSLSLSAHFTASVNDPNNDGRLAFENADHSTGELAQPGSLAGLVSLGYASPAGSMSSHLHLSAAPATSFALSLPSVDATIDVNWPDIATGAPSVTPSGTGTVGKFLNLTPRDLADGVAQLVTTLTSIQRAHWGTATDPIGNLDLPFLKGSLADAVQLNESLKQFLHDNVHRSPSEPDFNPATDDAAQAGDPTFVSLQQLLDRLNTATGLPGGATITISDVHYDDATSKIDFKISLHRAQSANAVDMNSAAAASSGPATSPGHPANTSFAATSLHDPNQHWKAGEFAGRHVVAGSSGATVVSNTADTLTLQPPGWTPAVPAANSPYTISGMQGDVGVVELGNSLQAAGHGVANANAVNATAQVKPSYDAAVTLVLDLRDPVLHDPPVEQHNPDGSTTLVSATPTGPDRVLLRTAGSPALFTADFPVQASIDLFANAGFLQVRLTGSAQVCQSNAGSDCAGTPPAGQHMLEVDLKDNGDLNFGQVVDKLLHDPGSLLDFGVHVRGVGSVAASVPGTTDFFHGASATAGFSWNDLTKLSGADGPQFTVSDLSELANVDFDPSNPRALFSIILKTLQTLDGAIGNADPSGAPVFNQQIPVVGRSLRDLLKADESGVGPSVTYGANFVQDSSRGAANGNAFPASLTGRTVVVGTQVGVVAGVSDNKLTMVTPWTSLPAASTAYVVRSELDDVITILEAAPSDNLQALVTTVNERLRDSTPISFEYRDVSGTPSIVIHLDWKRGYHTSAPFKFDFGTNSIAGAQGSGSVSLGVSGEIKIGLVVPLQAGSGPADAGALQILDDSKIGVKLDASVTNATLATTLGPLSLSLGDPTSSDKATAKASYSIDLAKAGATGAPTGFDSFIGDVAPALNASSAAVDCGLADAATPLALCAHLPLYASTDGGTTFAKLITAAGHSDEFALRLPKSTSPVGDYFDLTGAQIDGHPRLEAPLPADIAAALSAAALNFTQLDSIDSYLNLIEQSLNAASFGGKLPLIGDDLQQGADFIGKLRAAMHDALNHLSGDHADGNLGTSAADVRTALNGYIGDALTSAGLPHDLLVIDTECKSTLDSVGAPTITPVGTAGTAAYTTDASNTKHESKPGAEGSTSTGNAALSATDHNTISWTAVSGADGYNVYKDDGGTFKLLKTVAGQSSHDTIDDGTGTLGAEPQDPAQNPKLRSCGYSDLDSVLIRFDVTQGDFTGGVFSCPADADPHHCIKTSVPLDIGIPGLSLKASNEGDGPSVALGYHLHLAFGLSFSDGFFVAAKDQPTTPELAIGLNFNITGGSDLAAQLAFINITAHNCTNSAADHATGCGTDAPATAKDLFNGIFSVDLKAPGGAERLKLADLSDASLDDLFDVKLSAEVAIDWLLKAKVGEDAGFPGIQAEFRLHWKWDNVAPSTAGGDADHALTIGFSNIAIDTGEVFGHLLSPIVNKIKQVTGPLDPITKTLYAPIPVLSDLSHLVGGDDVTLISIAKAFSTIAGGPDLKFIDTITAVIDFINHFPTCSTSCLIPLGSFDIAGPTALSTTATPDNTESLISNKKDHSGGSAFSSITGDLDAKNQSSDTKSANPLDGPNSKSAKAGFSFPVFEHPEKLFNLLLGGDVDLVKFDSGPLTLGFDWRQQFGPVYAPPPVVITLHGSASVTLHIVAGFDTYGIRKAFEAARAGTLDIGTVGEAVLQSLFFYTNDDAGKPIPVVSFTGEIAAGAAVTAVIITVGIEGGLGLDVSFLWNDPNHDGKFRISEFLQVALNNPICLFSVSGRLYVFLKLYVTIGFSPFSVSFSFTIVDVTLLDFSATPDCAPPPPKLGGLSADGKTLVVYAGALGHAAQRGDPAYESNNQDKDTVKITSLHDYTDPANPTFAGVAIDLLGIRREFRNTSIERVVVDGRGYDKPMSVTFVGDAKQDTTRTGAAPPTAQFDRDAIVFGGNKNDSIKTGIGNSWVDGGPGDDIIVTADRTVLAADKNSYLKPTARARVAGGAGNDSITVGNGDDIIAGDSNLGSPPPTTSLALTDLLNDGRDSGNPLASGEGQGGAGVSVPNWSALPDPADGTAAGDGSDPALKVGLGHSVIYGNGGNDTLGVSADNPLAAVPTHPHDLFVSPGVTMVGGDDSDHFAGGSGPDKIYTAGKADTAVDGTGDSDANTVGAPSGVVNVVDTGTGNDIVHGGTGQDRVTGHSLASQHDDLRGGAGNDILVGGFGADSIYGGPDQDYVIAEPAALELGSGPAPDDGFGPLYKVTHTPLPAGVTSAKKLLVGGLGRDHIIGGDGGADVYGDRLTSPCAAGSPVASDSVDESVNTAADGNDNITGGAGVDNIRAGGGDDLVDAKGNDDLACGESGNDTMQGGSGDDQVWGGSGKDTVYGDAGQDRLYGNDGNDTMFGGDQADTVEANNGSDWVSGGDGDDTLLGGTAAAGRDDQGDTLSGDAGDDTIIGDNGALVAGNWLPVDLSATAPAAGGKDIVFGGTGNDVGFGGLDEDTMFGGTGQDHFEGNNADDTISGQAGDDELIGGSSEQAAAGVGRPDGSDTISGGSGADVITGDNAVVTSVAPGTGTDTTLGRGFVAGHTITLLDLGYSAASANSAGDVLSGDEGTDVIYGQGGNDSISGGTADDYAEGGPGTDTLNGNDGEDDLVGGSSTEFASGVGQPDAGDTIHGDSGADVILGDNGKLLRGPATPNPVTDRTGMASQRAIVLDDLGAGPHVNSSGDDVVSGDDGVDVILGQGGNDRLKGNADADYLEGDQGSDWIEGDTGDDDLVGGSSTARSGTATSTLGQLDGADALYGGPGDDAVVGDNARLLRTGNRTKTFDRLGSAVGTRISSRNLVLYDLNGPSFLSTPSADVFGDDRISGGTGVDVLYGQDGNDQLSGGPGADYLEGNGGADVLRGDVRLDQVPTTPGEAATTPLVTVWPGSASGFADLEGAGVDGQDDMLGGSSMAAFRDGNDSLEGDGESDFQLGDNGVLKRDIQGSEPVAHERVFVQRYSDTAPLPADATVIRIGDSSVNPNATTRFCTAAQATCEPAGSFGADSLFGDGGADTMWGQDGNDTMRGGAGDDDMYGELGDDTLFGEDGNDAILGDRGGVVDELVNSSDSAKQFTASLNSPPKESYTGFRQGSLDHRVDLLHDINGDSFVGSSTSAPMAHSGLSEGGNDRIRGGNGVDNIHAGFGDDLANGDSGGDLVFGDDGADVLWGGKGCDPTIDTAVTSPDCYSGSTFLASARGINDRFVDHTFGGTGGTSASSIAGVNGSDIMDWRPRGTPATCTANQWPATVGTSTQDPCAWFQMTNTDDDTANPATVVNNQHHGGTDWMYGGWDRDVMQGDVSGNGPNPGDRLLDWNGAYNLYTACNSAYGGFNDVRQHSPAMQTFLQQLAFGGGAGQVAGDSATAGTSAYRELALTYPGESTHGSGSAYPSTPGHFDSPYSCTD
jgi:Ca2+-binding RTX toxin-like protein